MRRDTKLVPYTIGNYLYFKVFDFIIADVWCWHFAVAASLGIIVGAQKTLAQGLSTEPKYIRNGLWSSEL